MITPLVAWDIDGTILHNVLELDFFGYVERWGGREKILPFNHLNPAICPKDIKYILTFRPKWMQEMTEKELLGHGFDLNKVFLIMNPRETDIHQAEAVKFKAKFLNYYKFDFYVDDDDILRMKLQPLTSTRCISTEEFYRLQGNKELRWRGGESEYVIGSRIC